MKNQSTHTVNNEQTYTEKQVVFRKTIAAVADCIRALGVVPSGYLYARLMAFMDLEVYEAIIRILIATGEVSRSNHLLKWIGSPKTNN